MELKRGLAIISNCMRMLEQIPWPDDPNDPPFYPSADEHLARAYQELDEAEGQLRSAVKYQQGQIAESLPILSALMAYTSEVLRSTRGADVIAHVHGISYDYIEANRLFQELPGWMRDALLKAQQGNGQKEKESV